MGRRRKDLVDLFNSRDGQRLEDGFDLLEEVEDEINEYNHLQSERRKVHSEPSLYREDAADEDQGD